MMFVLPYGIWNSIFLCLDFSRHSKSVQINRHEADVALLQFEKQFPQNRVGKVVKLAPSLICTDSQSNRQMILVPKKGQCMLFI